MAVSGLPPLGSLPIQRKFVRLDLNPLEGQRRLDDQNRDSQVYDQELVKLFARIQTTLPVSKIIYYDLYETIMDMVTHPNKYGFVETKKGCCESAILLCEPLAPSCKDPSKFLFWDMIHPTLATYQYLVKYILKNVLLKLL
ncbi:hypothetical protein GH714_043451 [Hevea brasiliensis]|uniref:GDSL esterase/lipase n=1 Tax=Hevea brasiliensis TaxID=3981 RepID=A0A6A6K4A7_HEVBR|nr:hypothetical protein GH714_043451 [Hevea brasiliensis]